MSTVLITGAARGIGKATAQAFLRAGWDVHLADIDTVAVELTTVQLGGNGTAHKLDVTSGPSWQAVMSDVGKIDVLVNNAGVMPLGRLVEEDEQTSRRTIEVNFWGPILGMKNVLPTMIDRGSGHVINVASMMGKLAVPGAAVYSGTKHAVMGLTEATRHELKGTGVTVSVVLPTLVRTDLVEGVPLGHGLPAVDPEDVADAILDCVRKPQAQVHVPRWLAGYDLAAALAPDPVMRGVRRALDHDRVLKKH